MEPIIHNISVKNFKSLKNTGILNLKPITLLVGPNSSGKTALIQCILMLKQTLESRNIDTPLVLRGRYVDLSSFRDVVFRHNLEDNIEITLGFTKNPFFLPPMKGYYQKGLWSIGLGVGYDEKSDRLVQEHMIFSVRFRANKPEKSVIFKGKRMIIKDGEEIIFDHELKEAVFEKRYFLYRWHLPLLLITLDLQRKREIETRLKELEEKVGKVGIEYERNRINKEIESLRNKLKSLEIGLKRFGIEDITEYTKIRHMDVLMRAMNACFDYLQKLFIEKTYYIGPLREYPQRYYIASGEYPRDVGLRGEHTAEVIYLDLSRKDLQYSKLKHWMKEMNIAYDIRISHIAEGVYALSITDPSTKIEVSLADVGFGASQVLPIIVEGIYASEGSVLLIEQPEIHLHPRLQATLMDFLIENAKEGKQVIVETHSEHLILRLQRRIAEGKLSHSDVALYYFENTEEGSKITEIKFDENGIIKTWPKGFFEEDLEESYSILRAIGERAGRVSSN